MGLVIKLARTYNTFFPLAVISAILVVEFNVFFQLNMTLKQRKLISAPVNIGVFLILSYTIKCPESHMVKTEYIRIYRGRLETYGAILIVMYEQSAKVIIVPRRII